MTERKLTAEQIEELFAFCRKHYVPQYDLQIELVDHMASSIEEQWETNPSLPFQEGLKKTFGNFGLFGFSKIKEQKEKELRKKYSRLFIQYLIDFYRWPKALLTISLTILLFILFRLTNDVKAVTVLLSVVICTSVICYHIFLFERYFEIKTYSGKSFLLIDYLKGRQIMVSLAYQLAWVISKIISDLNYNYSNHPEIEFAFAFFLTGFILLLYIYFFVVPQKIREHFTQQFPQFVKS